MYFKTWTKIFSTLLELIFLEKMILKLSSYSIWSIFSALILSFSLCVFPELICISALNVCIDPLKVEHFWSVFYYKSYILLNIKMQWSTFQHTPKNKAKKEKKELVPYIFFTSGKSVSFRASLIQAITFSEKSNVHILNYFGILNNGIH